MTSCRTKDEIVADFPEFMGFEKCSKVGEGTVDLDFDEAVRKILSNWGDLRHGLRNGMLTSEIHSPEELDMLAIKTWQDLGELSFAFKQLGKTKSKFLSVFNSDFIILDIARCAEAIAVSFDKKSIQESRQNGIPNDVVQFALDSNGFVGGAVPWCRAIEHALDLKKDPKIQLLIVGTERLSRISDQSIVFRPASSLLSCFRDGIFGGTHDRNAGMIAMTKATLSVMQDKYHPMKDRFDSRFPYGVNV